MCDKPELKELRPHLQCPFYKHESLLKTPDMYELITITINVHTGYIMIK